MNLFYDFKNSEKIERVKMKWPSDDYIIPAGTPMSRTGIANNSDAIGILASEARIEFNYPISIAHLIGKKEPKGNKDFTFDIITSGFVNLTKAEAAFGQNYTEEAKSAMSGINFVDKSIPSLNNKIVVVAELILDSGTYSANYTFDEMKSVVESGGSVSLIAYEGDNIFKSYNYAYIGPYEPSNTFILWGSGTMGLGLIDNGKFEFTTYG